MIQKSYFTENSNFKNQDQKFPQIKLKSLLDKYFKKIAVIALSATLSIGAQLPLALGTFAASTLLSTETADARPGYRVCINTSSKKYFLIKKGKSCGSSTPRHRGMVVKTCEQADQIIRKAWGKPLGKSACSVGRRSDDGYESNSDIISYKPIDEIVVESNVCEVNSCGYTSGVTEGKSWTWNVGAAGKNTSWKHLQIGIDFGHTRGGPRSVTESKTWTVGRGFLLKCVLPARSGSFGKPPTESELRCTDKMVGGLPFGPIDKKIGDKSHCKGKGFRFKRGSQWYEVARTSQLSFRWNDPRKAKGDWDYSKSLHRKVQGNMNYLCRAEYETQPGKYVVHKWRMHLKKVGS